jgi:hypothetical protein
MKAMTTREKLLRQNLAAAEKQLVTAADKDQVQRRIHAIKTRLGKELNNG